MNHNLIIAIVIFTGLWLMTGVGTALYVTFRLLNKYSNFGDFSCGIDEYSVKGIHYLRSLDEVSSHEKSFLFSNFGENPYANVKHSIPEQLRKNSSKEDRDEELFDSFEDGFDI